MPKHAVDWVKMGQLSDAHEQDYAKQLYALVKCTVTSKPLDEPTISAIFQRCPKLKRLSGAVTAMHSHDFSLFLGSRYFCSQASIELQNEVRASLGLRLLEFPQGEAGEAVADDSSESDGSVVHGASPPRKPAVPHMAAEQASDTEGATSNTAGAGLFSRGKPPGYGTPERTGQDLEMTDNTLDRAFLEDCDNRPAEGESSKGELREWLEACCPGCFPS